MLSELRFGSLLAYSPRGDSDLAKRSRTAMVELKSDRVGGRSRLPMSERVARLIAAQVAEMPFADFFGDDAALVPVPRSGLLKPGSLWVPDRLARALVAAGLGSEVLPCLRRVKAVPKASLSPARQRPLPEAHYESMSVERQLASPARILLIDDVVTRGSTLLGAARRIERAYPAIDIRAFAAMRTVSNPADLSAIRDPVVGTIRFREASGDTLRRP